MNFKLIKQTLHINLEMVTFPDTALYRYEITYPASEYQAK